MSTDNIIFVPNPSKICNKPLQRFLGEITGWHNNNEAEDIAHAWGGKFMRYH